MLDGDIRRTTLDAEIAAGEGTSGVSRGGAMAEMARLARSVPQAHRAVIDSEACPRARRWGARPARWCWRRWRSCFWTGGWPPSSP
ncbi:hypothetical protein DDE23_09910 [Pararhodobacter aggregans]|uniref:Uncharacterized protein n=1 Tax=Pararhodobacter aggregans TaxID=404875 RepID=A0A2T7USW0_9RHOB|nr:hypothetical protein DDE23_09910 [Pararhodobacter aggregans]